MYLANRPSVPSSLAKIARRRSILRFVLGSVLLSAASSAWWLRPSRAVVVRDGWVLAKDD